MAFSLHDLSPEAFARLLEAAHKVSAPGERTRDRTLLGVLYHGRLSAAEVCAMRLSSLTLRDGLPHLGDRPLPGAAQAALHHWLKKRKVLTRDLVANADPDAVWVDARGRALTEEDVHALLRRLEALLED